MHIFKLIFWWHVTVRELARYNEETCICFNIDLVLVKVYRFLAVYWNVTNKEKVSNNMAKNGCFASKVSGIILTIWVAVFDQEYDQCIHGKASISRENLEPA